MGLRRQARYPAQGRQGPGRGAGNPAPVATGFSKEARSAYHPQ